MKKVSTGQLAAIAMLSALAYVTSFFSIPIQFLSFELKDFVIAVTGFIYGPFAALLCAFITAFAEMLTFSSTGIIGCIMNILSSASFACTAAIIYKSKHSMSGAVWGLALGSIVATAVMLAWNYLLTPIYTGMPRQAVAGMLLPLILPFNLAKGLVNSAVTLLLYKHIVTILRTTRLAPPSQTDSPRKVSAGLILAAVLFLVSGVTALILL